MRFSKSPVTPLDVTKNTALANLQLQDNQGLESIDLSQNAALKTLYLYNTRLKSLDVSAVAALVNLKVSQTYITELDLSANAKLTQVECTNCPNLVKVTLPKGFNPDKCAGDEGLEKVVAE